LGRPQELGKAKSIITLTPQLKAFVKAKEEQARADTQAAGETVSPDVWAYFVAAGSMSPASRIPKEHSVNI
jgi:hypothetical protein